MHEGREEGGGGMEGGTVGFFLIWLYRRMLLRDAVLPRSEGRNNQRYQCGRDNAKILLRGWDPSAPLINTCGCSQFIFSFFLFSSFLPLSLSRVCVCM